MRGRPKRHAGRDHPRIRNLCRFEAVEVRGGVSDGVSQHCQVTLKLGFTPDKGRG